MHELILYLGTGATDSTSVRPGEPIAFRRSGVTLPADAARPLLTPDGTIVRVAATRSNDSTRVNYADTSEPGIYRLTWPNPPGGFSYALVTSDLRH